MAAPAVNKRKVFFVKETSDNYKIDISQLRPITRKQMEAIVKLSAIESPWSAAEKILGAKVKPRSESKKK